MDPILDPIQCVGNKMAIYTTNNILGPKIGSRIGSRPNIFWVHSLSHGLDDGLGDGLGPELWPELGQILGPELAAVWVRQNWGQNWDQILGPTGVQNLGQSKNHNFDFLEGRKYWGKGPFGIGRIVVVIYRSCLKAIGVRGCFCLSFCCSSIFHFLTYLWKQIIF